MLRKQILSMSLVLVLAMICATSAVAAPRHLGAAIGKTDTPRHFGPIFSRAYHGPPASVYFFPQDMDIYREMLHFEPWGLMSYRLWGEGFRFSFKGHNLDPRESYTLIYFPDPEGGNVIIRLGSGRANRRGQLNIHARLDICSLPLASDPGFFYGAQLMLVPTINVSSEGDVLLAPGSEENLTSYHAIRFVDTNGCSSDTPETPEPPADETGDDGGDTSGEDGDTSGDDGDTSGGGSDGDIDYDNDPDIEYPY